MFKFKTLLFGVVIGTLLLAACNPGQSTEVVSQGGNPLPTVNVGTAVGDAPSSQAAATPEETWSRYLADSFGALVAQQSQKLELRRRYQNPELTKEDVGGLLAEIKILEDRTTIKKVTDKSTNATANVDTDVRVVWVDGDQESFTCKYAVTLQLAENEDGDPVWYIINPDSFPLFVSCVKKR